MFVFRHYFQKVCYHWAKQGKFTPAKVKAIFSHTGSTDASAAWLLLSEISAFKPKLEHKKIIECFHDYMSKGRCSIGPSIFITGHTQVFSWTIKDDPYCTSG